jgi:ADP-ribose pyrophosphatase YjhB (NUDIX family)
MSRAFPIKQTVSVFVEREDGKILMVREGKLKCYGLWNQPGGHVEHSEDPVTAAIREARDETGYCVELLANFVTYVCPQTPTDPYFINYCFRAVLKDAERGAITEQEVLGAEWFSRAELKDLRDQYRSELTVYRTADWLRHGYQPRGFLQIPPKGQRQVAI